MGCNCGKNRMAKPSTPGALSAARAAGSSTSNGMLEAAAAMRGTTQQYSLTLKDGTSLKFGSKLEADAENVRRGYTGTVRSD